METDNLVFGELQKQQRAFGGGKHKMHGHATFLSSNFQYEDGFD